MHCLDPTKSHSKVSDQPSKGSIIEKKEHNMGPMSQQPYLVVVLGQLAKVSVRWLCSKQSVYYLFLCGESGKKVLVIFSRLFNGRP